MWVGVCNKCSELREVSNELVLGGVMVGGGGGLCGLLALILIFPLYLH